MLAQVTWVPATNMEDLGRVPVTCTSPGGCRHLGSGTVDERSQSLPACLLLSQMIKMVVILIFYYFM